MRHALMAALAALTALGLQTPSASAQELHSYSSETTVVVPGAGPTAYSGIAVNRNPSSPYKNYLYACQTAGDPRIHIYARNDTTQAWENTGLSVDLPSGTVGSNVAIAEDDSIWVLDWTNRVVLSAAHPTPGPGATAIATPRHDYSTTIITVRGFTVTGDNTNARFYLTSSNRLDGFSVSGASSTPLFNSAATHFAYGVTIDATGAVCVPLVGANLIRRYNPLTGAAGDPEYIAPSATLMSGTLFSLDFVRDASYPGGGYFVYAARVQSGEPYNLNVYRFAGDGTYLDGFGVPAPGATRFSPMNVPYSGTWLGAYVSADADGNVFARSTDGVNGNVIRVAAESPTNTTGPWGDVDGDGAVTVADADMVTAYIANPGQFSAAQRERIRRYGDVNGTVNTNVIGNDVVDRQDTMRMLLMAGGFADAGTAGPAPAGYGDINGDGKVDILDAVATQRAANGLGDAATQAIVNTRGRGDISPTIPVVTFGDKAITSADADTILARANWTETNPPVYLDLWPMQAPNHDQPSKLADRYIFTDTTGITGDLAGQITYGTQGPKEVNGFTITEVMGTDESLIGVFKSMSGSIYAKYLKYPRAFGNNLLEFRAPIPLYDASAAGQAGATWEGTTATDNSFLGYRPVIYKGAILGVDDVYTPAAGQYTAAGDTPKSTWSGTHRIRLDIGVLAGPDSSMEMQQAFFFDLMPFIGMVTRGQASHMGSPAPTTDRPLLILDEVRARGTTYNQLAP